MSNKNAIEVVKDEESGQHITITKDFKRKAKETIEELKNECIKDIETHIKIGIFLKTIRDEKYYKSPDYDYNSFTEFIKIEMHMSKSYAYNHIAFVERFPPKFVQRVGRMHLSRRRLIQLLPLPGEYFKEVNDEQIKELADMSDPDFNEETRKTKARYQKVRRDKIRIEEKNLALNAEKDTLLKEIEELSKEISILKTTEKNKKILVLQQSRENLRERIKELEFIQEARESKELKEELALAAIDEAQANITSAFVELRRIEPCPAILPRLLSFYRYARDILDTQITILMEKFDPNEGAIFLKGIAEEVEKGLKDGSLEEAARKEMQAKKEKTVIPEEETD